MIKFFALLLLVFTSVVFARVSILTWALQRYAKSHEQNLQFEITTLNFRDFIIKNIQLNKKNVIPLVQVQYDIWSSDFIKKIQLDIDTLDAESLQDTFAKLSSDENTNSEPFVFEDARDLCLKARKVELNIKWREFAMGTRTIPFQLHAINNPTEMLIQWDDQKNSKGLININCDIKNIQLTSQTLNLEVKDTLIKELKVSDFSIHLNNTSVVWKAEQPLEWSTSGTMGLNYTQAKQTFIWSLPKFEFNGLYNFDGSLTGEMSLPNLSLGFKEKGDQISGLNLSGTFLKKSDQSKKSLALKHMAFF